MNSKQSEEMERNVYSFKVAIAKGYEPRLYSYDADKIPSGIFDAVLDFKTWSKRIIAINCYFTKIDTKEKFIVTIYCNNQTAKFQLPNSDVDFSSCLVGQAYHISVIKKDRGKIVLESAMVSSVIK
jgi:hypothetical protein